MALRKRMDDPTVKARKILEPLWNKADLKGRCWGPKRADNDYKGTNITILNGEELVTVSQGDNGGLRIHEFLKTENTLLGIKVREIFETEGLIEEKPKKK
ncbi:hypothetical protein KJ934_02075 [Patescibacteria group bacterium]|nr:hypothetical protein [Patescibacteria group bacterium]MBU4353153.1 hypothetical protein [Patescibacteria group bacterium]MBU4477307.1 hypothetical protein [Patescibacteria group bacterium]MCG2698841.1 hypothetical protein [Candidatus Parcubacteria bacterium]